MTEMMDVMDSQGRPMQITRQEYAEQLMDAARQNWSNLEVLRQLGPQLLHNGFANEALEIAQHACELSGSHVPDLYWLAAAHAETGELDKAVAGFEELKEDAAYASDQARAAMGLARVRAKQGRMDEVAELLEWAVETDPTSTQIMLALYRWYDERKQASEGLLRLEAIATDHPQLSSPWRALTHIAASAGDTARIEYCGNEALKRSSDEDRQDLLAEVSTLLGQAGLADKVVNLLEPVKRQLQQPFALLNLAQAYSDTGRPDDARALLQSLKRGVPPQMQPMIEERLQQLSA